MITQLLTELLAAERTAVAIAKAVETAYNLSLRRRAPDEETAAVNPGPHQAALGAIRRAIGHVENIMGAADAQDPAAIASVVSQK
jgi:hypothetical protein